MDSEKRTVEALARFVNIFDGIKVALIRQGRLSFLTQRQPAPVSQQQKAVAGADAETTSPS